MKTANRRFPRILAPVLPLAGSLRIVWGTIRKLFLGEVMDEKIHRSDGALDCRDSKDEKNEKEREYRERVRESVERVRNQNREILDRLATK